MAYRETITQPVEKHRYTHKKQTGGSGQYADVIDRPRAHRAPAAATSSIDKITGGRIPKEYIPSVDQGIQAVARRRACSPGTRLVDVKATLIDG